MKTLLITALLSGVTTIAAAQTATAPAQPVQVADAGTKPVDGPAAQAPAVAPAIPLAKPGETPAQTVQQPSAVGQLAEGSSPVVTHADRWDKLPDTSRYLMIMGSVDGFASAGAGAPCFPGQNNSTLDEALGKQGFGAKDPDALPEALTKLSAPKEQCQAPAKRGYSNNLLKTMPDQHLATYLTGLIRSYARIKSCPADAQGYAAAMVTTAIFASPDDAQPIDVIQPALVEGCKGQPTK